MEKADDYLLQAIVETVVLVIFLASHIYLGCGISLRKMQQDGPEVYTQVDFYSILSVCCCFRYLYVLLSEHDDVKAFYNIIFSLSRSAL